MAWTWFFDACDVQGRRWANIPQFLQAEESKGSVTFIASPGEPIVALGCLTSVDPNERQSPNELMGLMGNVMGPRGN